MSTRTVLIDTSTLFSGLGWGGKPSRVLERTASEGSQLVVSDYIYDELFRHVSRKFEETVDGHGR